MEQANDGNHESENSKHRLNEDDYVVIKRKYKVFPFFRRKSGKKVRQYMHIFWLPSDLPKESSDLFLLLLERELTNHVTSTVVSLE